MKKIMQTLLAVMLILGISPVRVFAANGDNAVTVSFYDYEPSNGSSVFLSSFEANDANSNTFELTFPDVEVSSKTMPDGTILAFTGWKPYNITAALYDDCDITFPATDVGRGYGAGHWVNLTFDKVDIASGERVPCGQGHQLAFIANYEVVDIGNVVVEYYSGLTGWTLKELGFDIPNEVVPKLLSAKYDPKTGYFSKTVEVELPAVDEIPDSVYSFKGWTSPLRDLGADLFSPGTKTQATVVDDGVKRAVALYADWNVDITINIEYVNQDGLTMTFDSEPRTTCTGTHNSPFQLYFPTAYKTAVDMQTGQTTKYRSYGWTLNADTATYANMSSTNAYYFPKLNKQYLRSDANLVYNLCEVNASSVTQKVDLYTNETTYVFNPVWETMYSVSNMYYWGTTLDGLTLYDADDNPITVTLPVDTNAYYDLDTYSVDTTYTKDMVVYTHDANGQRDFAYTFSGWTDYQEGKFGTYAIDNVIQGEWVKSSVNPMSAVVSFDPGDGTFEGAAPSITSNQTDLTNSKYTITIPDAEPSLEGYFFDGWTLGTDTKYTAGDEVELDYFDGNQTFNATWVEVMSATVEFNSAEINYHSEQTFTQPNKEELEYIVSAPSTAPVREGFLFKEWEDSVSGMTLGVNGRCNFRYDSGNVIFTAVWVEKKTSTISFVVDGEKYVADLNFSMSSANQSEFNVLFPEVDPSKDDKFFIGWKYADDSATYTKDDELILSFDNAAYTFTAQWQEKDSSDVTFSAVDADYSETLTFYQDDPEAGNFKLSFPETDPSRDGYIFEGWVINESDTPVKAGSNVYLDFGENYTYTAVWTKVVTVTVNYFAPEMDYLDTVTYTQGSSDETSFTITVASAPSRSGYVFDGWVNSVDYKKYQPGATLTYEYGSEDSSITFSANWVQSLGKGTFTLLKGV
ncbi:MAG: InlB B-repeat-containing protein [Erysipelotrichaceae bacterium]|nr:InlB B-repeat-containing protein [Erysipelotrichaceae bacterium]